jgi:hypothetical protein
MNITRFTFCILLAALICGTGCATPDPLKGWHLCFSQDPKYLGEAIVADYQDYIQKLPPKEKNFAYYEHDFEDGAGQHAVRIEIPLNGTWWEHVLIYDKNNKRIKTIKYSSGGYRS